MDAFYIPSYTHSTPYHDLRTHIFLLQLMHLRHPLYTLLLLTFIISLEVMRNKR